MTASTRILCLCTMYGLRAQVSIEVQPGFNPSEPRVKIFLGEYLFRFQSILNVNSMLVLVQPVK